MTALIIGAAAWVALSIPVGVIVGKGIKLADGR